jgi:hypothetical protein
MKTGVCVYCGELRELTRDHIPPRCLFSKPRPHNLITVPCCNNCNRELSKHDEYFRIAIAAGIDKEKFPKENADSVRAINSLIRPTSQGFAIHMLQNYDSNSSGLTIERSRIEIVLYRIARGLFYHHRGERLPGTIAFVFRLVDASLKTNSDGRERINRLDGKLTTIGQGVFRYAFEPFEQPDPFGTVWLMRFYDYKTFFCITASE